MNKSSGNPKPSFWDALLNLFNPPKPPAPKPVVPPAQPVLPPDNSMEPARTVTARVLLVIYNPIMDAGTGTKLSEVMKWQDPDTLANGYIQDILETSGGLARYQIVQRMELNEFPVKSDGYRYDPQTYLNVMNGTQPPHQPEGANYQAILTGLNVLPRIAMRDIDEIWLMAFPHAGLFESSMGGAGAFWCNSSPMTWSSASNRRFIVMGFSYERGIGEMLESFGHRSESLIAKVFKCQDFVAWAYKPGRAPATVAPNLNLFQQFISFDQIAPGKAGVGTIHYAPNSERDYDWNNPRLVASNCYDWENFPHFKNDFRPVNADEWGNGDIRIHHRWWLKHLPKVAGRTGGVANNWWQYMMDPNLIY
jgi:hypothetical protein